MARAIIAVIVGYLVMAVSVMITLTVAWLVLGASFAFEEAVTRASAGWSLVALLLGLPCAMLGGYVAALIARSRRPVQVLAVLTLVLGIVFAVPMLGKEPQPRTEDMTMAEAMQNAVQPVWYTFSQPVVGLVGVLLGGALRRRPAPETEPHTER